MPTVEVEVDLDDFYISDIIKHLESILESKYTKDKERNSILIFCKESLGISTDNITTSISLLDAMKIELIDNNAHKFTLDELETFFKSK